MMNQILILVAAMVAPVALLYMLSRPYLVFVLVMVMFPLEQLLQVYVPFLGVNGAMFNYLVGFLSLTVIVIRSFREKIFAGSTNRIAVLVIIMYALWHIGIAWSPGKEYILGSYWLTLAYQVMFLLVMPLLVVDIYEFRKSLVALILVGSLMAVLILANPSTSYYSGRLALDLGMTRGGRAVTGNPLAIAELGAFLAIAAALFRPERATQFVTLLRVFGFIIGMGLAIGSGSRGQVLAAGLVGVFMFPVARQMANPKQFIISVIGLGMLVIGLVASFRMFIGSQNQQRWEIGGMLRDTTMRLDMVWQLFDKWVESPAHWLFGLGTNAYAAIGAGRTNDYVHNIAAEALCEHGLVGGALFVIITVLSIKQAIKLWSLFRFDPSMRATVAILFAFCLFTLLIALKQGSMSYPAPFFWWMIMAKLTAVEQQRLADQKQLEHLHGYDGEPEQDYMEGQPAVAY